MKIDFTKELMITLIMVDREWYVGFYKNETYDPLSKNKPTNLIGPFKNKDDADILLSNLLDSYIDANLHAVCREK